MPLFSSKLELTSAASSSGAALADVQFIRGAFQTVPNLTDLGNIPVSQAQHQQVVWVESESATYQATVTLANYVDTFTDSVSWSVFTGFGSGGGGGGATNLGDLTDVVTSSLDDGDVLAWNQSNTRWEPTATTLDTSSADFINGVINLDIFSATGSYYAATQELQVTGSISLRKDDSSDALSIYSGSVKTFGISGTGLLRLVTQSVSPTPEGGALFLDDNYNLWIGQD